MALVRVSSNARRQGQSNFEKKFANMLFISVAFLNATPPPLPTKTQNKQIKTKTHETCWKAKINLPWQLISLKARR